MDKKPVLLISFHNQKALGVRYLEKALKSSNYPVSIVFFKGFNSVKPGSVTREELEMLKSVVETVKPGLIGLSVMTSLYLETVYTVSKVLKENYNIPTVWGGVYPTLFPEKCLEDADFVIRGEGEQAVVETAAAVFEGLGTENILNLAYKKDGKPVVNGLRPLCANLDEYGFPDIGGDNKYFIEDSRISRRDPLLDSVSFELTASRGCPFVCSYCCSVNLHRLYKGCGTYVRFRTVSNVIEELKQAKALMKNLKVVHFWDEIFSDDESWIDEFTRRYKSEIGLPFEIWAHPLKVNRELIGKLVDIGLYKVVMGIQSGSLRVRKEIFHRVEKQEDIINASKVLSECKVPQVIYDFMLQHPFETVEDIKETYELCTRLKPPFELQLHGLNFLPGTDIVEMAINMKLFTRDELEKIMYSPIEEQYGMYWGYKSDNSLSNFWYSLTYLTQFGITKPIARFMSGKTSSGFFVSAAPKAMKLAKPLAKMRYYYKKGRIILKSIYIKKA